MRQAQRIRRNTLPYLYQQKLISTDHSRGLPVIGDESLPWYIELLYVHLNLFRDSCAPPSPNYLRLRHKVTQYLPVYSVLLSSTYCYTVTLNLFQDGALELDAQERCEL